MTSITSGLATFGFLKKRNFDTKTARRGGMLAASVGALVSFFGGRMLGEAVGANMVSADPNDIPKPHVFDKIVTIPTGSNFGDFLREQMFTPQGVLEELDLNLGSQTQLFDAINRTLVHRPDLVAQLYGINEDTPDNVVAAFDAMMREAPKKGIALNSTFGKTLDLSVFADEEFLKGLKDTIITKERKFLLPELQSKGGVDKLLYHFRSAYGTPRV